MGRFHLFWPEQTRFVLSSGEDLQRARWLSAATSVFPSCRLSWEKNRNQKKGKKKKLRRMCSGIFYFIIILKGKRWLFP